VPLDDRFFSKGGRNIPETEAVSQEEQRMLLAAVHILPPDRQQLLILKFVQRFSNAEIGQIMGRTEGAIKSLYHRTLNALRDELEEIISTGIQDQEPDPRQGKRQKRKKRGTKE
jgi:RNA polymerase sigma-70 factor (ECF subfamily)